MRKLFSGVPRKPSVELLIKKFGEKLTPQEVLSYEEFADTIGAKSGSERLKGIVQAFRKWAREERNIEFIAVPGYGLRVPNEDERLEQEIRQANHGLRKVVRHADRAQATDVRKLSEPQRLQREHMIRYGTKELAQLRKAHRQVCTLGRIQVLPKPRHEVSGE